MSLAKPQLDRLHALSAALLDDTISPDEFDQLTEWLRLDVDAQEFFVSYVDLHCLLRRQGVARSGNARVGDGANRLFQLSSAAESDSSTTSRPALSALTLQSARRWRIRLSPKWLSLAASLLVVGYFVGMAVFVSLHDREVARDRASLTADQSEGLEGEKLGGSVATLRETVGTKWSGEMAARLSAATRHGVQSGESLKIESGLVELKLHQGTTLLVEGPAQWSIDGDNRATLLSGKLVAKVPNEAYGFTLDTPTAKVIDLGTEFGVKVDAAGAADVHVFQGTVVAESVGDEVISSPRRVTLKKSEAARFAPDHASVKKFAATPEKFSRQMVGSTKPVEHIVYWTVTGEADWDEATHWEGNAVPGSTDIAAIKNGGTAVIRSQVPRIFELSVGWKADVPNPSGFVQIETGGLLTVAGANATVGVKRSANVSVLTVTGGSLKVVPGADPGHLIVGDEPGSKGEIVLSGGTILATSTLRFGAGQATLTIVGSRGSLTVGGDLDLGSRVEGKNGELALQIGETGIAPVQVGGKVFLSDAALSVSLIETPPASDLVLIDVAEGNGVSGSFADLPDESPVSATFGKSTYNWLLSYDYDAKSGSDGSGNDIALKFVAVSRADVDDSP